MSFETIIWILLIGAVLFIAFLLILIVAFILGRKAFQKQIAKFLKPDPNDIQRDLERLRNKYPNLSVDETASKYVGEQAVFLGIVGFVTEVWGFFIPVLGFTIDAGFTTLRQMKMVHVITALYGGVNQTDSEEMEMRYMAMVGAGTLLPRFILKFLVGEIPFVGGIVNFGINWFVTNSIGKAAIGWNTGKSTKEVFSNEMKRIKDSALSAKDMAVNAVKPNSRQVPAPVTANNETDVKMREAEIPPQ